MLGLCQAINSCLAAERGRTQRDETDPGLSSLGPRPFLPQHQPDTNQPEPPRYRATRPNGREDFEIAIICALKVERDAVEALLDEEFEIVGFSYGKAPRDVNAYTTAQIGQQAVALAYMPYMGKASSARVAAQLPMSFTQLKVVFLVGICGAAPQDSEGREIFLGDVVISTAVIQADFGRQHPDGFLRKGALEDTLGRANPEIGAFLQLLEGKSKSQKLRGKTLNYIAELCAKDSEYAYPVGNYDNLYRTEYRHKHQNGFSYPVCAICDASDASICKVAIESSCVELGCSNAQLVLRKRGETAYPGIHFGRFASGDTVMKSGFHRDKIVAEERVIAFEMEGAGCWDCLPR
ncbi:hypothetical protein ABW19_dt0206192 [Dactylella cylindrospora]|nr:hypothetical protein ABW19_dt0206192 [Dactylella cylindrospora]